MSKLSKNHPLRTVMQQLFNKDSQDSTSQIIPLLRQEEGVRYTPYLDSLNFPTAGVGFKLGPTGAALSNYTFTLDDNTINAWLQDVVTDTQADMGMNPAIFAALATCNYPRQDILTSMAYQMGVDGLGEFHDTLTAIAAGDFDKAAQGMLNSSWATETPDRAQREAAVMKSGSYDGIYDFS